jgi:hypothetical protein
VRYIKRRDAAECLIRVVRRSSCGVYKGAGGVVGGCRGCREGKAEPQQKGVLACGRRTGLSGPGGSSEGDVQVHEAELRAGRASGWWVQVDRGWGRDASLR